MSLRTVLRGGVAAVCIAATVAPAGVAAPARTDARGPLDVRVAQAKDFTRLEFHWTGRASVSTKREGQVLTLRFSRGAKPDIASLKAFPPKWLKKIESRDIGGRLEVALTLADDAEAKVGQADGTTFVNLFAAPPKVAEAAKPAEPKKVDPVPAGGIVRVRSETAGLQTRLVIDWNAPTPAAVFRRGDAIWVVFDAPARLDVSGAARSTAQYTRLEPIHGEGFAALRIVAPAKVAAQATGEGPRWTVALGPQRGAGSSGVAVERDLEAAPAGLKAELSGASRAIWVDDPAVGDRLAVVPALAPSKGVAARRAFAQLAVLPSSQGLAVEPYAGDLNFTVEGDLVRIGRPQGLALSATTARPQAEARLETPQPAGMPALIDETWGATPKGKFLERYNALQDAASDEAAQVRAPGKDAPVAARMALARFLVGSNLGYEAIGVLNNAARSRQSLMGDPEFRGLRGVARISVGRFAEAEADLSSPVLLGEASSSMWRGYAAAKAGDWATARKMFEQGTPAFEHFSPVWKARFAAADAEAAVEQGDLASAREGIATALAGAIPAEEQLKVRLIQARLFEMSGDRRRALNVFKAVATAPLDGVAAPALLNATRIQVEDGKLTPDKAAAVYDQLRYRWRGDATELKTIRTLGSLYLGQGRYREALEALRSAGQRLPDHPEARLLQADLSGAFRALFLDGMADGLQPIQALALFYDFKDLTPIGADGDLMVRNLVRRLVDVDLLDQAADLLKYQVDNRLDGAAKSQIATDLAVIYLMNRKPENALRAINETRTTVLTPALNADRRVITARAMVMLGRTDAGLEIIEQDKSREAADIRAEAAWKQRDWPAAGQMLETALGERWKTSLALGPDEEGKLLRAGVAYSLAGDEAALGRLRGRYSGLLDQARNPDALRVALAGPDGDVTSASDFTSIAADSDAFSGWVSKMKERFRTKPEAPKAPPAKKA
ncbi:tetratricopeptide repeat protein [Caulobacter sp. NIBR2454]|uniref:tetratricopeptide repeat protein n=1 Tax=Caulobacter sp. NIBR2454 TaxID=3015996 RepID=UPI0022B66067|nr:tetratricopeptide repeat protein [Caulobacter sp. NIBR2454]